MSVIERLNGMIERAYGYPFNSEYIYVVEPYDFMNIRDTLQPRWIVQDWCEYQLRCEYEHSFFSRGVIVGIDWMPFLPSKMNDSN